MVATKHLPDGSVVIVDDCDAWLLGKGAARGRRSIKVEIRGRSFKLARAIMGPPPEMVVDHINGDILDNRRANLRICTVQENNWNRRRQKTSASGFKGVYRANKHRWRAVIFPSGKRRHLGCFVDAEEAARAYDQAALEEYGEFACLNFPAAPGQRSAVHISSHAATNSPEGQPEHA